MSYEIHPKAKIGHIHLTVGNLDRAVKFYTEMLGFSVTARFGDSAMFLSSGNYHRFKYMGW
jgi:catechol 2,3-dioxygenase